MEKFTSVCGSSDDEFKLQKHKRIPHQRLQHFHPSQNHCGGPYGASGDHRKHSDNADFHHHAYQNYRYNKNLRNTVPHPTLPRASTSSLSSSSSSSSSPWTSEPSLDKERYLMHSKPQHSLSCSNIPEARHQFRDEESEELDFDLGDSSLYQHHHQQEQQDFAHLEQPHLSTEQWTRKSRLNRGHSKSEEGLLQNVSRDLGSMASGRPHPMEFNPLYKTTSLGQNLAFNESAPAAVEGMVGPKRAVSSIQLPSKGILKNKDEGQKQGNFRKAKSMEVLSTRVKVTGPRKQSTVGETVRENLVKEKLEFSAFLDEITRQVISPSSLSSFGIIPTGTMPTSPKSPQKELRQLGKEARLGQECVLQPNKQQSSKLARSDCLKTDTNSPSHSYRGSHSSKYGHDRQTGSSTSPPQNHQQQHNLKKQISTTERHGGTSHKKTQHGKYSQLLTDDTSTSPESVMQEKHHHAKSKGSSRGGRGQTRQLYTEHEYKGSPPPARPLVLESESPVSSRKSSIVTSPSSDKSQKNKQTGHRRHYKYSHQDSISTTDRAELLEQYNKELHENLLQTVACIENMESEIQCTKAELNSFKEKYKRLQESYANCQQANSVLEQKLQAVVDSMNSERRYHLHRIVELTKQLDAAKNTIISLENINVPSLIKELLDKHFDSKASVRNFLLSPTSPEQSIDQSDKALGLRDNQSPAEKGMENMSDWLLNRQRNLPDRQQHVTAFLPWAENQDPWCQSEKMVVTESEETGARALSLPDPEGSNLPLTVADLSMTIYKKIAEAKVKRHEPIFTMHHLDFETEIGMLRPGDVQSNPYSLEEILSNRATEGQKAGTCSDNAQQDQNEVGYVTAQKMLDNFVGQIPRPTLEGHIERDHRGRDWARGPAEGL